MKMQALENDLRLDRLEKLILDINAKLSKNDWTLKNLKDMFVVFCLSYTSVPSSHNEPPQYPSIVKWQEIKHKKMP